MRIPRRKAAVTLGAPSRRAQIAAVFALAALLGVSVLYDSAHIAASLRRHSGYNNRPSAATVSNPNTPSYLRSTTPLSSPVRTHALLAGDPLRRN
jgi:hypothetical protein